MDEEFNPMGGIQVYTLPIDLAVNCVDVFFWVIMVGYRRPSMSTERDTIEALVNSDYKWGFVTEIDAEDHIPEWRRPAPARQELAAR